MLKRLQRITTWFQTNWVAGQIVWGWLPAGIGGLVAVWLTSLSSFLKPYAPISYGIAALIGMLAIAICLALFGVFRRSMADAAMRNMASQNVKSVNYLDDYFNRKAIKISDFEPIYGPYRGKKFVDCDIIGPAVITLSLLTHKSRRAGRI